MTVRTNNPTRVPGFPKIPATAGPELARYLEALQEAIDIRLGRRGDQRDRAVTLRELIESGLAYDLKANPFDPNNIGATNIGFAPLNEVPNLDTPPQPTGFTVSGAFSQVNMTWDFPLYQNHAHTEIWRHSTDSIGDAQLIGIQVGRGFVDPIGSGQTRYYWIRHVSQLDVKGPFNATAGTVGQTATDVNHLLEVLSGSIAQDDLTTALQSKIDDLDVLSADVNTSGSVAAQIAAEASARASAISSEASTRATAISNEASARTSAINTAVADLQGQIDDLNDIDDWDSSVSYAVDDLVKYSNKLWKAVSANSNSQPATGNSNWTLIGDYTSLGDAVVDNTAKITQINYVNSSSTSAAAQAIATLQSTVNDSSTGVAATASGLSTLTSTVNNSSTGLSATVSNLTALETALFEDLLSLTAWSNTATYAVGDRVSHSQKAYRATQASNSSAPKTPGVDTGFWSLDTIGYASAISDLSTTLANDYTTSSSLTSLLANKEDTGTAASLISASESTAASTYATATNLTNLETATFTNLTGLSVYNSANTYASGDRVIHGTGASKAIYTAVAASSSSDPHAPGDTSYWSQDALASNTAMLAALAGKETSGAAASALSSANTYTDNNAASASDFTALETSLYEEVVGVAAWSNSTSYAVGDRVYYDQKIWRASQAHSGQTPASGSSYWAQDSVASAAVLSDLSTNVTNNYATTAYVTQQTADFVTDSEQQTYVANQISASETTAASTYATASNVTALETALFNDMTGVSNWSSSTAYVAGNRVIYDRKVYRAVASSTNVTPGTNATKWALDTLAKSSAVDALENTLTSDYALQSAVTALSTDLYQGAFDATDWNSSTTYAVGAKVVHAGAYYIANTQHSNQEPPNTSYWDASSLVNQQTLSSEINTATSGLATSTALTQVRNDAYNNLTGVADWNSSTSYSVGDRVVYTDSTTGTRIYKALLANSNSIPASNISGSTPKWRLDPVASSLAVSELSSTLTNDYSTTSETSVLLAQKENSGTAASLISDSEATAASTYATISTVNANYAAIFTEMTGLSDWNSGTTYNAGDRVIYATGTPSIKKVYRALQSATNRNPSTETAYWALDTLAFAAALDTLDLQVNRTDGTGIADRVSGIQLRLDDIDGDDTNITMEQRFTAQSNDIGDLESRYTVKIDADGHVAGFGLASATNAADGNTSRFFINADRFAIVPEQVTNASAAWTTGVSYSFGNQVVHGGNLYVCQLAHTSTSGRTPGTSGGDSYWVRGDLTPFVVQRTATTDPDGNDIPPGVYMNTAAIKTASITAAMIGSVNADRITTGTLDVAELIDANAIDASKLTIDGSEITSVVVDGVPTLQLGSVNVNKLTGNSISANIMSGTTVYANKLTGDVNKLVPFRQTTSVGVAGNTSSSSFSGERTIIENQLPATTHLAEGHRPFASMTGYIDGNASKTYRLRMYMKDNTSGTNSLGQPASVYQVYTTYIARFTGDQTSKTSVGATLTSTGKSHTATSVSYSASTNLTSVGYSIGSGGAFTTQNSITSSASGSYELVGEQRFKATTDNESPYAISGSLGAATRGTIDVKLTITRYGGSGITDNDNSTGVDYVKEVSGVLMGIH